MDNPVNARRQFIIQTITGATGILLVPAIVTAQETPVPATNKPPLKGPPLDTELVKEFVVAAHKDLAKVKSMLQENPDLLNASFQWKDWDWEDAIGGAGHMGLRDIAIYLLEQGARPTICVAAMLGQIEVVRAFITAFPDMKNSVGPHKIPLMVHARKGGKESEPVVEYLKSIGLQ